jgi:SHS2 domain-containing protein
MGLEPPDMPDDLYREFEHTGDIGIEVEGASRVELFARAVMALARIMVDPAGVRSLERRTAEVTGSDDEELLHDLLAAALNLFLADGYIWRGAEVAERDGALTATLAGEPYDAKRHELRTELKAVTYHELRVVNEGGRWHARVIFDV